MAATRAAMLETGTTRADTARLVVGPWRVDLHTGYDPLYGHERCTSVSHAAALAGELEAGVRAAWGEDGLRWLVERVAEAPVRFASTLEADRRAAQAWALLPREASDPGWRASGRPRFSEPVAAGGASWDGRSTLTLADGSTRSRYGDARGALATTRGVWVVQDGLLVAVDGLEPAWMGALATTWALGGERAWVQPVTLARAGEAVAAHVYCGLPPESAMGAAFVGVRHLRLDPDVGPVAVSR